MPLYYWKEETCCVCRHKSNQIKVKEVHWEGWGDLDTRQPDPYRSLIHIWLQQCPHCGHCRPNIERGEDGALEVIESKSYKLQLQNPELPDMANKYLCWAMILTARGEPQVAASEQVKAAWVCDDLKAKDAANRCRTIVLDTFHRIRFLGLEWSCTWAYYQTADTAITDLLRRVGRFDEALSTCGDAINTEGEEIGLCVLEFEKDLILKEDDEDHTVEEALATHLPDWANSYSMPSYWLEEI